MGVSVNVSVNVSVYRIARRICSIYLVSVLHTYGVPPLQIEYILS